MLALTILILLRTFCGCEAPSIGQKVCQPMFSEISTLYLGTGKQSQNYEIDEFIEISFPKDVCKDQNAAKLNTFEVVVLDSRPRSSTNAGVLLYASLYHRKLRTGSWYFVIGSQEGRFPESTHFDFPYRESHQTVEINGICRVPLEGSNPYLAEQLDNEKLSHYPVVYVLYSVKGDQKTAKVGEHLTYMKRKGHRMVHRTSDLNTISQPNVLEPIFEGAVDVVIVNRNDTVTKKNSFLLAVYKMLEKHGIKPGVVGVSVDYATRDIPRGSSISFCPPTNVDSVYERTHPSMYWKESAPTPGASNDCRGRDLVRFDENSGYTHDSSSSSANQGSSGEALEEYCSEVDLPSTDNGNDETVTTTARTEPSADANVCYDDRACNEALTRDDFQALAGKIDYLYSRAVAQESLEHKDALEKARKAVKIYADTNRKDFFRNSIDTILDSGALESDKVKDDVKRLTDKEFQYFRPLLGDNWTNGKRKINLRCEPCYESYMGSKLSKIPQIARTEGIPISGDVIKTLRNHLRKCRISHHQAVVKYEKRTDKITDDYLRSVDAKIDDPRAATARLFFLAYSAVKMYLPPFQFPALCNAAAALGMSIGDKHRTRKAYVSMANLMSSSMEEKLLMYIKANQSPFSLLIDSSTDRTGKKVLLVFIRFPSKISFHPTTHFLKAFEIKEAETGLNMFRILYQYFRDKNLLRELTWNLVSVATDGASNMVADGGLQGILNKNVSRARVIDLEASNAGSQKTSSVPEKPVLWIHCMAHKIELALTDALMDMDDNGVKERSDFYIWRVFTTKFLNELRTFFTQSSSRRRVLEQAGVVLEQESYLRLRQVIEVRWAASERDAVSNFLRIYKHLWMALDEITMRTQDFDARTRLRAAGFLYVMRSLPFYRYVVYQFQLLDIIAKLSKSAQKTSSTIWQSRMDLSAAIAELQKSARSPNDYPETKEFIRVIRCAKALGGSFTKNALDDSRCAFWFWTGWDYENLMNREIVRYRLHDAASNFEFSLSERVSPAEMEAVKHVITRSWEKSCEEQIQTKVDADKRLLIEYIKNTDSDTTADQEQCRENIANLAILKLFRDAAFTNMDFTTRETYAMNVIKALKSRLLYPDDSVLYAISAWSPENLKNYDPDAASTRKKVADFFGFNSERLESEARELQKDLSKPLPPKSVQELDLAGQSLHYFLPVLHRLMTTEPIQVAKKGTLMRFLSKIVAVPTNTAEVERGFSLYFYLMEPRRSSTLLTNMESYMRIVLNGPESPPPYYFNYFVEKWTEAGHVLADHPGATRGPGKVTEEEREKEKLYQSLFSTESYRTHFYFSEDTEAPIIHID